MKFEVISYSWDLKRWIDKIACGEIHRKRLVSGYQASDLPHSVVAHIIKLIILYKNEWHCIVARSSVTTPQTVDKH